MFADSDGSKDPNPNPNPASAPKPEPSDSLFSNRELTLSYLCEKPLAAAAAAESPPAAAASAGGSGGDDKVCVERDFLQLSGGKRDSAAAVAPGDDSSVAGAGKKPRVDSLHLSLGPPSLSLSLTAAAAATTASAPPLPPPQHQQQPSSAAAQAPTPARRTYSATTHTRSMNSDDMSYSYSVPFSHNPSCSLTRNSTDNYDIYAGEGTNGSVHSRFNFRPVGDGSVAFAAPPPPPKELSGSFYRGAASGDNVSFFPSELPARMGGGRVNGAGPTSLDSGRSMMMSRPDRILREIVSDSVSVMAQILHEFPSELLEVLREAVRNMIDSPEKKDELASLQRKLERRSDLTMETLSKSNKTQLEILVAIKTGMAAFVTGKGRVPSSELVEMFLLMRCRNLNCKNLLPVDDCECKICSAKKGFCSACMCPVCLQFDCAANTCSWVGCDVCSHWCHAACALERNLIRPGQTLKGPIGTSEMQFQCLGCSHASEMFGFVKEVFNCCAERWGAETLMKELDFVRKIFCASEDFEGKGLHAKAEEVLNMLGKKIVSPSDATGSMLQFFKYGVTDYSVTGSKSKGILTAQASQSTDILPLQAPPTISPPKSAFNFKTTASMLETQIDALKASSKPLSIEPHFTTPSKDDDSSSLETIVKCKEAEAKLFQKLADDARREVENYCQIVRAKSQKLEEECTAKLAKLCFQEIEEKRRKKLEELKMLENSYCDYHKMKLRMQTEIQGLLERMEATKKMWV